MLLYGIIAVSVLALVYVAFLAKAVAKKDAGSAEMQKIATSIATGAMAFLKAEYKILAIFVACVAILLAVTANTGTSSPFIAVSFIVGALCSALA